MNYTKQCTKCQQEFPATTEFFRKYKKGKYGLKPECKTCAKLADEKYREKQTTKLRMTAYYNDNKESIEKKRKQYYQNNKESIKQKQNEYDKKNKQKKSEYMKIYYRENKEDRLKYYQDWKENKNGRAIRSFNDAQRRLKKQTQTQFLGRGNPDLIAKVYQYCPKGYEVDHMLPLAKGGDHHESNLCYLPKKINRAKGDKLIEEFGVDIFNENVIYWQDMMCRHLRYPNKA